MFKGGLNWLILVALSVGAELCLADELKDPTRPPNVSGYVAEQNAVVSEAAAAYRLSMTKTGGATDVAVINGKSVKVGERIDGAEVSAIRAGEVDLMIGVKKHLIKVQKSVVKQPVNKTRIEINARRIEDEG